MLIQFRVGNYRSFRDTETLGLSAANLSSHDPGLDENNVVVINDKFRLLKSAAIYGANASGKSNLCKAISFMRNFVLSRRIRIGWRINIEPFRLNRQTASRPSVFEAVFLADGCQYRYGFEVFPDRVQSEWLYDLSGRKQVRLFLRQDGGFQLARHFREGRGLEDKTRPEALFLSVVAQFNGPIADRITHWFSQLISLEGLEESVVRQATLSAWASPATKDAILQFVQGLDLGVGGIEVEKEKLKLDTFPPDAPEELLALGRWIQAMPNADTWERVNIKTIHSTFDEQGEKAGFEIFELDRDESDGTQKLFSFAGPILNTLKSGGILVIDELDARLHPSITRSIVSLFNSNETNQRNAQLIFTTHDTNLLSSKLFRRDQVWFVEKDRTASSHLISLAEYRGIRNDSSIERDYIHGKFGAVPFIGDLSLLAEEIRLEPDAVTNAAV